MLSNFTKSKKTFASIPLSPQLHPEFHRGIDPVGSLPASAGRPTALTTTWRGSAVPGCWQRYGDLGEASPASIQQYSEYTDSIRCAKHWRPTKGRRHNNSFAAAGDYSRLPACGRKMFIFRKLIPQRKSYTKYGHINGPSKICFCLVFW